MNDFFCLRETVILKENETGTLMENIVSKYLEEFCKKISHTKGDQLQIINLEHMKLTREIANVIENYNEMANKMNENKKLLEFMKLIVN